MGTLVDMAHSEKDINWAARKRVDELSTRRPSPDYLERNNTRKGDFLAAAFCCIAVALFATTVVFFM
jgi:hypothetical protein